MSEHRLSPCHLALERANFTLRASFSLPAQGITGLLGYSGSGKTSLLRCLAGLEPAARGRVGIGADCWLDSAAGINIAPHRRRLGYVFQEPRLFEHLDVRGNLEYARRRAVTPPPALDDIARLLGIEALLTRRTAGLSGGEQQRVAIGRALLRSPRLLLMDEPLASVDVAGRGAILEVLDRVHAGSGVPMLYVSHSVDEVLQLCDRLIVLDRGRVVAEGTVSEVTLMTGVPVLSGDDACSVFEADVVQTEGPGGLTELDLEGDTLLVPGIGRRPAARVRVRILARDVSLAMEQPPPGSILNVIPAQVERIVPEAPGYTLVYLRLRRACLVARITAFSCERLGLAEGARLFAQVKAAAVKSPGAWPS